MDAKPRSEKNGAGARASWAGSRAARERILIVAAAVCVAGFLADRMVISPLTALWKSRAARFGELRDSLDRGKALLEQQRSWKDRWQEMQSRCLPVEESVAENMVLKSVDRWAQRSRLQVTSIKPRMGKPEDNFKKIEFRAAAQGSMSAIARFLYELERDPLALRLENVDISAHDEGGATLTVNVLFTALLLTAETSAGQATPAPADKTAPPAAAPQVARPQPVKEG